MPTTRRIAFIGSIIVISMCVAGCLLISFESGMSKLALMDVHREITIRGAADPTTRPATAATTSSDQYDMEPPLIARIDRMRDTACAIIVALTAVAVTLMWWMNSEATARNRPA